MAEDAGDKTEAPTSRRLQEAREQGNIPRSHDLSAAVLLLGSVLLLQFASSSLFKTLRSLLAEGLGQESLTDLESRSLIDLFTHSTSQIAIAGLPILGGIAALCVVVNVAQVGFQFSSKPFTLNFEALNPIKGWERVFPKGQAVITTLLSLGKLIIVGSVAWSAICAQLPRILMSQQLEFGQIVLLLTSTLYSMAIRVAIVLLILGILDYVWQRYRIMRDLRMTKQEVKDEMRMMDGDPQMKSRRRQLANQMAQQRLKKQVPQADVVVTNPTHFAVALKYDQDSMHAPRVVAKGQDLNALRIRRIAAEHGIPVLERKPLARALYKMCEVGQEIPEEFYSTVAEILAYVYEITGKIRRKQGQPKPQPASAVR